MLEIVPNDYVWLRITRSFSSWQNTGKNNAQYSMINTTRLYGSFSCSNPACYVAVWVSSLSPTYTTVPYDKLVVGNFSGNFSGTSSTIVTYLIDLSMYLNTTAYYQSLGFDMYGMVRGDTIKLYTVLASDNATITACQTPNQWTIHEPSSSIDVADPTNVPLFDYFTTPDGQTLAPGQCYCKDPSYGGTACDELAIISYLKGQKEVCGGFPKPGYNAVDYNGNIVPLQADGSWLSSDGKRWGCATENAGLILRTRPNPITRFDFPFVYETESTLGESTYIKPETNVVNDLSGEDTVLDLPGTTELCAGESTALASWLTGTEALSYYQIAQPNASSFVDLARTPTGDFRWTQRDTVVVPCSGSSPCGTAQPTNPCLLIHNSSYLGTCFAIQYNNLVYNVSGTNMTDGATETAYNLTGSKVLTLRNPIIGGTGCSVRVYNGTGTLGVVVTAPGSSTTCVSNGEEYQCATTAGVSQITLFALPSGISIREVLVYSLSDPTRFLAYYT